MKKSILFSIVLIIMFFELSAQKIGVSYAPPTKLGGLISTNFRGPAQLISSFETGYYKIEDSKVDLDKWGIGISYEWFVVMYQFTKLYNLRDEDKHFNLRNVHENSIELGALAGLGQFNVGIFYDTLNYEGRFVLLLKLQK